VRYGDSHRSVPLNAQSVVLSGITFYWNHRNDDRAAAEIKQQKDTDSQREDSQLLGTMLPYLTSPDLNVRLRAVEVITARRVQMSR
jgi:hypothetical protein